MHVFHYWGNKSRLTSRGVAQIRGKRPTENRESSPRYALAEEKQDPAWRKTRRDWA